MTEQEPRLHEKIIRLLSTCDRPLSISEIAERLGWPGGPADARQAVEESLLSDLSHDVRATGDSRWIIAGSDLQADEEREPVDEVESPSDLDLEGGEVDRSRRDVNIGDVIAGWQTKLLQLDRRKSLLYFRGKRSSVAITAKSPDDLFQRLQRARSGLAFLYAERRRSSQSQFEEPSQTLFSCVVDRFQIRKRRTLPDSQQK